MAFADLVGRVDAYYSGKLRDHGPTPRGVDWNSAESQASRFDQLLGLCEPGRPASIVDYGCGYGALVDRIEANGLPLGRYLGFDASAAMIAEAIRTRGNRPSVAFTSNPADLVEAEYALASGTFNVRLDTPDDRWRAYILEALADLDRLGRRGFAFNMLTSYSDADRMRTDLYYGDPCFFFDHCKRRYSRQVALLHDYGLFEFTIRVRK